MVTSKEASVSLGISYSTITYYTNIGLFKVIGKKKNERLYDFEEMKKRMAIVSDLIVRGYPLRLIAEKLNNNK